jgi:hypothetical protein
MATRLDRSKETGILITCTDCDYWFSYQWDTEAAYRSAANHDSLVHPGEKSARDRLNTFLSRKRDKDIRAM